MYFDKFFLNLSYFFLYCYLLFGNNLDFFRLPPPFPLAIYMEYHRLKPRFDTAAYDPKRISFVYVLSQNEGKGPYKVGMSKGDLWRRMSNYATAFVDFYVYYLVPVPYADVFAVERFMHRALPGRKAFPSETKERGNLSEWFDCSQRDLRRAFRDLAKDPKLNPIGAFRVTKNKIYRMTALEQDKGEQLVTRSGRTVHERRGHGLYFDNNRLYEGITYKFVQRGRTYPALRAAAAPT